MRKHASPALVVALIALTLSLMGVGYAAITLPRDSVGKAQIRAGAVGSAEVADGSLKPIDFSKAALARMAGVAGPKGETGAKGETGPAGAAGTGGSGGGTGLNVIGGDGTVVGTFVSFGGFGSSGYVLTVQMPNGLLFRYENDAGATWRRPTLGPFVASLAADCSEPRYTLPSNAAMWPNGGNAYFSQALNWAYTIGTERISPVGSSMLYFDGGGGCNPWDTVANGSPTGELVRLEPTAIPPILTTPVNFG
ncbi:MAG: hypothetical protein KGQ95_02270 [Acidobacteria bacterium]|nr:hypothetical protein [Acidobacteriota bacterium]